MRQKRISILLAAALAVMSTFSAGCGVEKGGDFAVTGLQTETVVNPIGIDAEKPEFSWKMDSEKRGEMQEKYRIMVASTSEKLEKGNYDVWDSGETESGISQQIPYGGEALAACTRYYWKVQVTDQNGRKQTSEPAFFETGLMEKAPFSDIQWLSKGKPPEGKSFEEGVIPAPMFRREFSVQKEVARARLYMTSAGVYEAYINGTKTTDSYLNPGRTTYNRHLMYQTFDVTELLTQGENAIGVVLGHGWFNRAGQNYGGVLGVVGKLVITYTDGSSDTVTTDGQWQYYYDGPVRDDDIYNGEKYDATKEVEGWANAGLKDTSLWTAPTLTSAKELGIGGAKIVSQNIPLSTTYTLIKAVSVTEPVKGTFVYDFGQNLAGFCRIRVTGQAGQTLTMKHGEWIHLPNQPAGNRDEPDSPDGTVWTKNLNNGNSAKAEATDTYVMKGDPNGETFEPSLIYHGFRYMQVEGLSEAIPLENVEAVVLCTDLERTGDFECSDELVNKFVQNTLWSQIGNFLSVPTDCPQRNERFGWTGDAQIFARTGAYLMDIDAFMRKFSQDMRDVTGNNGNFPEAAPGWHMEHPVAGWTDAGVIIPWQMYQQYGDLRILRENYEAMRNYVILQLMECDNYIDQEHTTYGDWLSNEATPKVITESAFAAYICGLFVKIADTLGLENDVALFSAHYEKYKAAWNREFVNADGSIHCDPKKYGTGEWGNKAHPDTGEVTAQCPYILGLQFDLFPDSVKPLAAEKLVQSIRNGGYHIKTGFLGVSYLLPVLTEYGYVEDAYKMMQQTERPSWLYAVTQGATTIPETWWAVVNDNGAVSYTGSQNHYSYGSASEWLFRYVLGIDRDEKNPGFKHILLNPTPGGTLTYAKGHYLSAYGDIEVSWYYEGEDFVYEVSVPSNTTATLTLPAGSVSEGDKSAAQADGVTSVSEENGKNVLELGGGKYKFTVKK